MSHRNEVRVDFVFQSTIQKLELTTTMSTCIAGGVIDLPRAR